MSLYKQLRHCEGDGNTWGADRLVTPTASFGALQFEGDVGGPIVTLMLPPVFPASHFDTESQLKRGAADGESYLGVRPVVDNLKLSGPRCVKRHVRPRSGLSGTVVCGNR